MFMIEVSVNNIERGEIILITLYTSRQTKIENLQNILYIQGQQQ